ncbi:MAG TPA: glycoside hydrolase family 3 N-terminal domain-containing protein [Streptosporangiaceae bacterium]|nr:glycoside hydrolase family 3 N-terminal domain-containing protein [Streptosporangiaceae bacterium]
MTALSANADPVLARLADAILIPPFPGRSAPRWILEALSRGLAGVTLFGPNIAAPEQVSALTVSLRSAASVSAASVSAASVSGASVSAASVSAADPVIAIDEEGGDVTRVAYADGSPYPGNAALGAVDDVSLSRAVYRAIGLDLAALGINFNLAPCADVLGSADSPAVGTRSFGADTDLVSRHTAAAVAGLQSAGVAACAKHFPGHGRTGTDTHFAIATIEGGVAELRQRDLPPFAAAIRAGTIAVMPSHLRVPELTGDLPATVSAAALTGLLRGELGFTGVIVSDALEMRAVRDRFGVPGAAVLAVAAGTDLLCLGRDSDEAEYLAVRSALVDAVRDGTISGTRLEDAADRVARLRGGLARARSHGLPAAGVGVAAAGVGVAVDGVGVAVDGVGLAAARRAVRTSGPRATLSRPLIIEVEPLENIAAGRFGWGLGPWAPADSVRRVNAGDGQAAVILAAAAGRSLVAVVRDAHRDANARSLVSTLLAARPDTVLVEMGLPRWQPPDGTSYLATYGASRASAQAAAELLGLA